jgi:ribosome-binding protein aMBF1 (putative translation factor)
VTKHAFCRTGQHVLSGFNVLVLKSGARRCRQCYNDGQKRQYELRRQRKHDASVLTGELDPEKMSNNELVAEHDRLTEIVMQWEKVSASSREKADKTERNLTRKISQARSRADRDFNAYKKFVLQLTQLREAYDRRCKAADPDDQPF